MKNLIMIFNQLAALIKKNIPIINAFSILESLTIDDYWQKIVKNIKHDLQNGITLNKSFINHIPNLQNFILNIINIGELTNTRHQSLVIAAKYLQAQLNQRKEIIQQLIYPCITVTTAILIILLMQHLIIPNILNFYQTLDLAIPISIHTFVNTVSGFEILLIILAVMISTIIIFKNRWPLLTVFYQQVLYNAPIINNYIKLNFCYSFCLNFMMLLSCQQTPSEALRHISSQHYWPQHIKLINNWRIKVAAGINLSTAIQQTNYTPIFMHTHIAISEQSGEVLECFEYLSKHFQNEINEYFVNINRWLEPLIVLSLGLIIGIISLCIYYPIFQISSSL